MLAPVREHFANDPTAKALLEKMEGYMAERAAKAAADDKAAKKAAKVRPSNTAFVFLVFAVANSGL